MQRITTAAIALVCILLAWWLYSGSKQPPAEVEAVEQAQAPYAATGAQTEPPELSVQPSAQDRIAESKTETTAKPAQASARQTRIIGRLIHSTNPVAGCTLHLTGFAANDERLKQFGNPTDWKNLTATTDAEGRFTLSFDPPGAFQFILEVQCSNYGPEGWRWSQLDAGQTIDLGDIALLAAGTIRGVVVDGSGTPVPGAWQITAQPDKPDPFLTMGNPRMLRDVRAVATPATGTFELLNVASGPTKLRAIHPLGVQTKSLGLEVTAGSTQEVQLVYEGPQVHRRLLVELRIEPWAQFFPLVDRKPAVYLNHPAGERQGTKIPNAISMVEFDDLDPGVYTATLRHPWWDPWTESGLAPGTRTRPRVTPSARVAITVVDDVTSAVLPNFRVTCRFQPEDLLDPTIPANRQGRYVSPVLVRAHTDDRSGVVDGLLAVPPIRQDLVIEVDGYAALELLALQPVAGAPLAVQARMTRGRTIEVQLMSNGAPLAGAQVGICTRATYRPEFPAGSIQGRPLGSSPPSRTATTDDKGRVLFTGVPAGEWLAFARPSPAIGVIEPVPTSTHTSDFITLQLPASGSVRGKLLGLQEALPPGWYVEALPPDLSDKERMLARYRQWFDFNRPRQSQNPDGSFHLPWVQAGAVEVALVKGNGPMEREVLGKATVPAGGEVYQEYTVAISKSATAKVHVKQNGQPLRQAYVQLVSVGTPARTLAQGDTDANGTCLLNLQPTTCSIEITSPDMVWTMRPAQQWELAPGATTDIHLDFPLQMQRVQFVNSVDDTPLATMRVVVRGSECTSDIDPTDPNGYADLSLTPGSYTVTIPMRPKPDGSIIPSVDNAGVFVWPPTGSNTPQIKLRLQ